MVLAGARGAGLVLSALFLLPLLQQRITGHGALPSLLLRRPLLNSVLGREGQLVTHEPFKLEEELSSLLRDDIGPSLKISVQPQKGKAVY